MIVPQQEFQEKNVKKAVAKACHELKIDAAKLDYKIISHGSSGIFGLVMYVVGLFAIKLYPRFFPVEG